MSMQIFSLILVTVSFTLLAAFVFAPRNKSYFENMALIPLEDNGEEE